MTTMRNNAITKRQNNFTHADQLRKMQNKHINAKRLPTDPRLKMDTEQLKRDAKEPQRDETRPKRDTKRLKKDKMTTRTRTVQLLELGSLIHFAQGPIVS